ncbi:MAG: hypothetical protein KDA93_00535 [Planctomycetaceae bacterium]|nr:hypothetical protein [Planctomycetaceae bacterium]
MMRQHRRASRHSRAGFSLMEVLLATAILMGSVVVLGELASIGRKQAQRGRELAEAQQRCETLLNEVLLGLRPLTPVEQEPLLDNRTEFEPGEVEIGEDLFNEFDPFAPAPLDEQALTDFDETEQEPDWLYSLLIEPMTERPGLALLKVSVEQSPEKFPRPARFELSRWIDDPSPSEEGEFNTFGGQTGFTSATGGSLP